MDINKEDITSFLTFRHPLSSLSKYSYSHNFDYTQKDISFSDAKEEIYELLSDSIVNLIGANTKVGVMMSGGVDSCFLALLAKVYLNQENIHIYTAYFKEDTKAVESKSAAKFAKLLDLPHTVVEVDKSDYFDSESYRSKLITLKGEPLHPNEIALAKAEEVAKKDGAEIIMCGEGADDILGGYSNLLTLTGNSSLRELNVQDYTFIKTLLDFYRYFSLKDRQTYIRQEYLANDVNLLSKAVEPMFSDQNTQNAVNYFIQKIHTPGLIKRGRNAGKLSDLPVVFPYMDKKLVEFSNTLPFEYKIFGNISKFILRETMLDQYPFYDAKELTEAAYRPKCAFPVPFDIWAHDIHTWDFDKDVFKTSDISGLQGWQKWMLINLNTWVRQRKET